LRHAGAVILGKTNMDEFAMGSSGENSAFGATRNPWDTTRVPGGSSSGSAAAVAARLAPLALGSDTGGSVRQPGAFCGVVAVKPTYGRVSRFGLVAFASSLDQIGCLATTVADARLLLRAVAGHDARDATSDRRADDWLPAVRCRRVGIPRRLLDEGIDDPVRRAFDRCAAALAEAGCTLVDVELPSTHDAIAAYYVLSGAEASSNLARFDGVRYGRRVAAETLDAMITGTRSAGFGTEVKRRIMVGTYVLSSGYYDAYYGRAQCARAHFRARFRDVFSRVEVVLMPTSPTLPFALGERLDDPLAMYLSDAFTVPANLAELPAISVPASLDDAALPIGVQLVGPRWSEETLFDAAALLERQLGAGVRLPPLAAEGDA